MIDALKRLFTGGGSDKAEPADPAPEVAAAVLMVQAALADGEFSQAEREKICLILKEGFRLEQARADAVLNQAEEIAHGAVDHHSYTKVVKRMPKANRMAVMTHLWMVALADGVRDDHEDSLLRRLSPLLALSDRERAEARQAAEGGAQTG
ncbi:MAG: TerB family tellurite resistance protein [Oceanicaulis sp.]